MRAIGQRRGSMRHVQNFARLRIILRRIQGSPPHVPKSNQITQGNVEAKVGHRADNGVLTPLNHKGVGIFSPRSLAKGVIDK